MNTLTTTLCATAMSAGPLIAAGLTPEAFAQRLHTVAVQQAYDAETSEGRISSIASDKSSFVLKGEGDRMVTITINEKTVFSLDGQPSTRDKALAAGRRAKVAHEKGIATSVEVMTER